jgi:hypothetical protein
MIKIPKLGIIDVGPKHLRLDWDLVKDKSMEDIQKAKFTQHPELRKMLEDSAPRKLVYADPDDGYWGVGPDGLGKNKLGEILMKIRTEFLNERAATGAKTAKLAKAKPKVVVELSPDSSPATPAAAVSKKSATNASAKPVVAVPPPAVPVKSKKAAPPPPAALSSDSDDAESSEEEST